jgi:hypothetical protein
LRPDDGDDDLYILPEIVKPVEVKPVDSEISAEPQHKEFHGEDIPVSGEVLDEGDKNEDNNVNEDNESNADNVSTISREENAVCTDIILSPRRSIPRPSTPPVDESPSLKPPKMGPLVVVPPQGIHEISPPPSEPASPASESDSELITVPRDSKSMSVSTTWCTENDVFSDSQPYIERPITPASSIRSADSRRWSAFSRFSTNTGLTTPPPTRPGSTVNTPGTTPMKLLTWTDSFPKAEIILDGVNSSRPQSTYQTPTKARRPLLSEMKFESVQKERRQLRRWSSHLVKVHTQVQSPILLSPAEELVASIEDGYMFPSPEREAESPGAVARRSSRRRSRKPTVVELNTAEEFKTVRELFDQLSDVEEEIHRLSEGEDDDDDEDDVAESRIVELKDDEEIEVGVKGTTEGKREKLLRRLRERARKLKTKVVTVVRGGKKLSSVPKESTPAVVVV